MPCLQPTPSQRGYSCVVINAGLRNRAYCLNTALDFPIQLAQITSRRAVKVPNWSRINFFINCLITLGKCSPETWLNIGEEKTSRRAVMMGLMVIILEMVWWLRVCFVERLACLWYNTVMAYKGNRLLSVWLMLWGKSGAHVGTLRVVWSSSLWFFLIMKLATCCICFLLGHGYARYWVLMMIE